VKTYDAFKETLEKKGGFIRASWCSNSKCEEKIKEETGATIRIVPFEKEKPFSDCVYCGEQAEKVVYFARSY
jgi:prolyl-tRNA synthetase